MVLTLSSEGQVTIPPEVREKLHLKPGDRIQVSEAAFIPFPQPALTPEERLQALARWQQSTRERLKGSPWEHMTVQEMIDDMRGRTPGQSACE